MIDEIKNISILNGTYGHPTFRKNCCFNLNLKVSHYDFQNKLIWVYFSVSNVNFLYAF